MKRASLLILSGSVVYSGAVLAASAQIAHGPSWEVIGMGAIGLLISGIGWYAKGVSDRVGKLEDKVDELNSTILKEYHPKTEILYLLGEVKASVADLHKKFEHMEQIYGR